MTNEQLAVLLESIADNVSHISIQIVNRMVAEWKCRNSPTRVEVERTEGKSKDQLDTEARHGLLYDLRRLIDKLRNQADELKRR